MSAKRIIRLISIFFISAAALGATPPAVLAPQTRGAPAQSTVTRRIGAIKAINGNVITLTPSPGDEITVTVQPTAHILRLAPGERDLKNTTPIQLHDLQVGDTIRVRGFASDDAKVIPALEVILITRSAVAAVSEQIRQDWQKRGMGGMVSAVDPTTHTITISVMGFGGTRNVALHTSNETVFRGYAPESVKFEDAKASTLQDIHPGDQLRARGTRSADGSEFTAEEIVSGSFRNIAGTVNSVDAAGGTITIQDLLSKKSVQIKITADSHLRKLPAEIAQGIAMRLKGMMPAGMPGAAPNPARPNGPSSVGTTPGGSGQAGAMGGGGTGAGGMGGRMRSGGAPDFQQMLSHMPPVALADLHKGDAVMMVATQGTPASASTAITLLSGVEPILEAAPTASQAMMLAPWSLGGVPGADTASQ